VVTGLVERLLRDESLITVGVTGNDQENRDKIMYIIAIYRMYWGEYKSPDWCYILRARLDI